MSISISNAIPQSSAAAANFSPVPAKTATTSSAKASSPAPAPANDTVQISSAVQAALKESIETPAQTAHEANAGDPQAKRLVAKEAADKIV